MSLVNKQNYRTNYNPNNLTNALNLKFEYARHLQRLMNQKAVLRIEHPKPASHLNRIMYNGGGPRKSLDQKITFINENNNLARKIITVGRRDSLNNPSIGLSPRLKRSGS